MLHIDGKTYFAAFWVANSKKVTYDFLGALYKVTEESNWTFKYRMRKQSGEKEWFAATVGRALDEEEAIHRIDTIVRSQFKEGDGWEVTKTVVGSRDEAVALAVILASGKVDIVPNGKVGKA